jgi:hypothetical protein
MSEAPRGFHLRKVKGWWIIVPMIGLTPLHKIEEMEGEFMDMLSFRDKQEAISKMFDLMDQIEKRPGL